MKESIEIERQELLKNNEMFLKLSKEIERQELLKNNEMLLKELKESIELIEIEHQELLKNNKMLLKVLKDQIEIEIDVLSQINSSLKNTSRGIFSFEELNAKSIDHIQKAFQVLDQIKLLDFNDIILKDKEAENIAKALKEVKIDSLSFVGCLLSDFGMSRITEALDGKTIKGLHFRYNFVVHSEEFLEKYKEVLKNNLLDDPSKGILIIKSQTGQELSFANPDTYLNHLAKVGIKNLTFESNHITQKGLEYINENFNNKDNALNKNIENLTLELNEIEGKDVIELLKSIDGKNNLKILNLNNNILERKDIIEIKSTYEKIENSIEINCGDIKLVKDLENKEVIIQLTKKLEHYFKTEKIANLYYSKDFSDRQNDEECDKFSKQLLNTKQEELKKIVGEEEYKRLEKIYESSDPKCLNVELPIILHYTTNNQSNENNNNTNNEDEWSIDTILSEHIETTNLHIETTDSTDLIGTDK